MFEKDLNVILEMVNLFLLALTLVVHNEIHNDVQQNFFGCVLKLLLQNEADKTSNKTILSAHLWFELHGILKNSPFAL